MQITAHVAGVVTVVNVQPGNRVEAGDEIVVLESMKMELPLVAPTGGTVVAVQVQHGELVEPGQVLVVLT